MFEKSQNKWKRGNGWAILSLFYVYFKTFQTNNTIFTTKQCEKISCPSSIRCRDSKQRPLKRDSPPVTTGPWLPPTGWPFLKRPSQLQKSRLVPFFELTWQVVNDSSAVSRTYFADEIRRSKCCQDYLLRSFWHLRLSCKSAWARLVPSERCLRRSSSSRRPKIKQVRAFWFRSVKKVSHVGARFEPWSNVQLIKPSDHTTSNPWFYRQNINVSISFTILKLGTLKSSSLIGQNYSWDLQQPIGVIYL